MIEAYGDGVVDEQLAEMDVTERFYHPSQQRQVATNQVPLSSYLVLPNGYVA